MKNQKQYTIALAGNPNSGKTSIFNRMTGSNQTTGNWPGVTVERKEGRFQIEGKAVTVIDLPGIYSLTSYSPDEKVARDFLIEREDNALLGIEIKAGSAIGKNDFKHMKWFHNNLTKNQTFIGVILYTGEFPASFGNNLWAVPFGLLWS